MLRMNSLISKRLISMVSMKFVLLNAVKVSYKEPVLKACGRNVYFYYIIKPIRGSHAYSMGF